MTIIEILDGLAELGRLRIERERQRAEAAQHNAGDGQGKGASTEGKRTPEYRAKLRKNLTERFNRDELRTLCFDLGIEYENLPETKDGMARELVAHCERIGSVSRLVAKCGELRPNVAWEDKLK